MTPRISYHGGHSGDTCDHARDTKVALLEAYIAKHFTHVGLTEHLPPPDDTLLYPDEIKNGHDSTFLRARFEHYFTVTRSQLRKTYGDKLHLTFSFETEWYGDDPECWLETNIEKYRPDYIVASVHHVEDIPIDMSPASTGEAVLALGGVDTLYQAYYDRQHDLFVTLAPYASRIPIVVAHFDLIKLFTPDRDLSDEVWQRIVRNLEFAIANDFVFEVNARAFKK
ncbi:MAG TPA: histidinol-phosphatase HisJ family protein, partial [Anaerolineales bacterium]|nr:histidinol-phosphatase HisJ family protein [Anaerolineales bacterium]